MIYGSSKVGSSGSSSFLSSSGFCDLVFVVILLADNSFQFSATNNGTHSITITAINYAVGGSVNHDAVLPLTLAPTATTTITATESFDVRGLTVEVVTDCGTFSFVVPVS